jgi:hypothetical protein
MARRGSSAAAGIAGQKRNEVGTSVDVRRKVQQPYKVCPRKHRTFFECAWILNFSKAMTTITVHSQKAEPDLELSTPPTPVKSHCKSRKNSVKGRKTTLSEKLLYVRRSQNGLGHGRAATE